MKWTGGCLCGAIRYEVKVKPTYVGHCHCKQCRRFTGSAFMTGAVFPADSVEWTTQKPTLYPSSPGVDRGFCPTCGSSLSFHRPTKGRVALHIGSLDRPEDLDMREPREFEASHTFFPEKIPWVHVEDDLPRFDRFPT